MKIVYFLLTLITSIEAQSVLTEEDAIKLAFKHSPSIKASDLEILHQKQLEKTSFNLANPELNYESPTGEFYSLGVMQTFDFPTVYVKQRQVYKQQTELAKLGKNIVVSEFRKNIRTKYLDVQYTSALLIEYQKQDSLFYKISESANRQFASGQIDYVSKILAANAFGEIHNQKQQAESEMLLAKRLLNVYTGKTEDYDCLPLKKWMLSQSQKNLMIDENFISNSSILKYSKQEEQIAGKTLQLEKHKVLPGLSIGYMNQGPHNTPTDFRFRVGISLPVWFWQYSASIKSAKTKIDITKQQTEVKHQYILHESEQLNGDRIKYEERLKYYETLGLLQSKELVKSASRMFEAGRYDYITYLRVLSEAGNIQIKYIEALKNYNQSVIDYEYIYE